MKEFFMLLQSTEKLTYFASSFGILPKLPLARRITGRFTRYSVGRIVTIRCKCDRRFETNFF